MTETSSTNQTAINHTTDIAIGRLRRTNDLYELHYHDLPFPIERGRLIIETNEPKKTNKKNLNMITGLDHADMKKGRDHYEMQGSGLSRLYSLSKNIMTPYTYRISGEVLIENTIRTIIELEKSGEIIDQNATLVAVAVYHATEWSYSHFDDFRRMYLSVTGKQYSIRKDARRFGRVNSLIKEACGSNFINNWASTIEYIETIIAETKDIEIDENKITPATDQEIKEAIRTTIVGENESGKEIVYGGSLNGWKKWIAKMEAEEASKAAIGNVTINILSKEKVLSLLSGKKKTGTLCVLMPDGSGYVITDSDTVIKGVKKKYSLI